MPIKGERIAELFLGDIDNTVTKDNFSEVHEVGTISLVGPNRKYEDGCSQLKFLHLPSKLSGLALDLNDGLERAISRTDTDESCMEHLLHWIADHKEVLRANDALKDRNQSQSVDFVCRRGALTKMATAPYETSDDWVVGATRHNGVIYLTKCGTVSQGLHLDRHDPACSFRGHKFEQYITTAKVGVPPNTDAAVNEREAFYVVLRRKVGNHSLIISSEVDASDLSGAPGSTRSYVELKTCKKFGHPRKERNFRRYKLLQWWAQSFLAGIPRIVCGFRDDSFMVRNIEEFVVDEIPRRATGLWKTSVCKESCARILTFVKRCLTKDEPRTVYLFSLSLGSRAVICSRLREPGEYQILPEWYLNQLNNDFSDTPKCPQELATAPKAV